MRRLCSPWNNGSRLVSVPSPSGHREGVPIRAPTPGTQTVVGTRSFSATGRGSHGQRGCIASNSAPTARSNLRRYALVREVPAESGLFTAASNGCICCLVVGLWPLRELGYENRAGSRFARATERPSCSICVLSAASRRDIPMSKSRQLCHMNQQVVTAFDTTFP